ncbi:alpha/beta hydrolase [Virgibacillus flavescens]|uniref:alpha/beta hydrolase n=1 Tax=Virgibacillus flavescens TaxID=1611422 RepID=UPI003D34000F
MKKKYIIRITNLLIIIAGIAVITYMPEKAKSQGETVPITVFVHGYKGTHNSFGSMLDRFESNKWGEKALVYRVSREGDVRVYNLNKGKTKPVYIQVIFEDNRASFKDGARWLSNVLSHMKQYYQINNVNLVGHSMGGLISVKYIEEYGDASRYPVTDNLVTIGSPFDGIHNKTYFKYNRDEAATDLKPNSAALQLLRSTKEMIPSGLNVLNIGSTGDPIAVPESVRALRMIIPAEQLETVIIENDELGHSQLHESQYVDQLIHSFLGKTP